MQSQLNHNVRKRTFGHVRSAKIQIRLRMSAVWSESSLGAFWIAKVVKFPHADNEDSDQTVQKRSLISVLGAEIKRCVFSCCDSFVINTLDMHWNFSSADDIVTATAYE